MNRSGFRPSRYLCAGVLLVLGWAAPGARGQISIALKTDFRRYLRYEPVSVTVILRNLSGNTLVFGKEGVNQGYLRFRVERQDGSEAPWLDRDFNPVEDLVLGAGESRQLALALNAVFDLQREGTYSVTAQLGHRRLPHDYRSEAVTLDVREGLPVLQRNIGLPTASATDQIQAITVSMLLFHDGEKGCYCLRAEDDKAVYGTVRLGPQITGSQPQMDVDAASDVHVLIQLQPRLFAHLVYSISPAGVRLRQRQQYLPDAYGPRLTRAPGYVRIVGGNPLREGMDQEGPIFPEAPAGR
ncbi:MAG: hypothetical protein JXR77_17200 [Lentisphaeria bacterium]|nr:hypothetical protein [Lentisphaeria bacterium]